MTSSTTNRTTLSVRTRFEVFKRDNFTCRYCGRTTPEVVLEIDHVVPVAEGGSNDPINLVTACWDCNSGKSNVPLNEVITGEDPHDRAILLLEQERQLREYNEVLARIRAQREGDAWELWEYWQYERGYTKKADRKIAPRNDIAWIRGALAYCPKEQIRLFMDYAIARGMDRGLRYVGACVRNWREEHQAIKDFGGGGDAR